MVGLFQPRIVLFLAYNNIDTYSTVHWKHAFNGQGNPIQERLFLSPFFAEGEIDLAHS